MNKNKLSYQKLAMAAVLIVIWFFLFPKKLPHTDLPQICHQSICYDLEIADTIELRSKWLMFRDSLAPNAWMIFIFPDQDVHKFWMKNTLIPLDMIRLSSWLQVLYIQNALPCEQEICPTYWPDIFSKYVLEINWWLTEKIWLKVWDIMEKKWNR